MDTYKGHEVMEAQAVNETGQPVGPRLKGLPRDLVESDPELAWMLDDEQEVPEPGEPDTVYVLADAWSEFRPEYPET